jgi:branched-chain amino acid transport system substrate-binding protein
MSVRSWTRPAAIVASALLAGSAALCAAAPATAARTHDAAAALKAITIGTLYAGSGSFATSSLAQYSGLKFWVSSVDKAGGVYVRAAGRKLPVHLVAYNDQSSTSTATTLYDQLITENHVNILVADFGSVLTSVGIPVAAEHKMLLFDVTGTGASFFKTRSPYIVLTSLPSSAIWPDSLARFLISHKIHRVAILYDSNDFDQSQAATLAADLKAAHIQPVYDDAVPTATNNYTVLIHDIAATHPDAVCEFGYDTNDIPFLQNLAASGEHFPMVFTVFPGQEYALFLKNVGAQGIEYTYTYPTPPLVAYNHVNFGPGISSFLAAYQKAEGQQADFLTVAGYNAGLVIQKALATAPSLSQLALRRAVQSFSGHLFTLDGLFAVNASGAQVGETLPVAQFQPYHGSVRPVVVFPAGVATGKAVYPAP